MSAQVKSKQRVQEHGEVFTNEREVNAMLDMIKQETERIESRFLEPACGDGNFLAEVLRRKLAVVDKHYRKSPTEYMRYAFVAVASIYGVDILEDNAHECRERLYGIVEGESKAAIKGAADPLFLSPRCRSSQSEGRSSSLAFAAARPRVVSLPGGSRAIRMRRPCRRRRPRFLRASSMPSSRATSCITERLAMVRLCVSIARGGPSRPSLALARGASPSTGCSCSPMRLSKGC